MYKSISGKYVYIYLKNAYTFDFKSVHFKLKDHKTLCDYLLQKINRKYFTNLIQFRLSILRPF